MCVQQRLNMIYVAKSKVKGHEVTNSCEVRAMPYYDSFAVVTPPVTPPQLLFRHISDNRIMCGRECFSPWFPLLSPTFQQVSADSAPTITLYYSHYMMFIRPSPNDWFGYVHIAAVTDT